ncbi:MAG: DUF1273 family protein [Clostridia bacterium]|nr:DUF1273 family protein [Clostridia bacterium]
MAACCFTGHRDLTDKEYDHAYSSVSHVIKDLYYNFGVTDFYVGGALGFDTVAADALIAAREEGIPLKMILAVPCSDQDKYWTVAAKRTYRRIMEKSDRIVILNNEYYNGCMLERNRYMVDRSDFCVAFLRSSTIKGGTLYTIRYAQKMNKTVVNVCED